MFKMREVYKKSKDSNYSMSEHNPIELLNKDPEVVRNSIKKYFTTGKAKFKLYKNGLISNITDNDIDAISEFLQGGLLQLLEKYRNLNKYNYDYIFDIYNDLMNTDDSPFESIHDYFKSFFWYTLQLFWWNNLDTINDKMETFFGLHCVFDTKRNAYKMDWL